MALIDFSIDHEEIPLRDFKHFLEIVDANSFSGKRTFYRGQRCQWDFQPSIARVGIDFGGKNPQEYEQALLNEFKRQKTSIDAIPETEIEWMAFAQHEGIPTRLLDWSSNPLVALYFAVKDGPVPNGAGRCKLGQVMIYVPENDRVVSSAYPWNPWEYSKMVFIVPDPMHFLWNKKLEAQHGCFSLHMFNPAPGFNRYDGIWRRPCSDESVEAYNKIVRINIPLHMYSGLKAELENLGFNSARLFGV